MTVDAAVCRSFGWLIPAAPSPTDCWLNTVPQPRSGSFIGSARVFPVSLELQLKCVRLVGRTRRHHSLKPLSLTFIVLVNKSGREHAALSVQLLSPARKENPIMDEMGRF